MSNPMGFAGTFGADEIDRLMAVLGVDLFHYAVDVVFYGELGEVKVGGYFFVG